MKPLHSLSHKKPMKEHGGSSNSRLMKSQFATHPINELDPLEPI
jgi:hypothetical protein